MTKSHYYYAAAGLALAFAASSTPSLAQDDNFNRAHSVAVNDRARDEYTPIGVRWGVFLVQPSLGVSLGTNDNVLYVATGKKSEGLLELTPGVDVNSDWNVHAFGFGLNATADQYGGSSTENTTTWNAHANGRFDITSQANLFGHLSHEHDYEPRSNYLADPTTEAKPVQYDVDNADIGVSLTGNRLRFVGTAASSEETYKPVAAVAGGTIDQSFRDLTTTTVAARLDYAVSPNISLFLNTQGNKRKYKIPGNYDSTGSVFSVGTSFDLTELIRGQVEVGTLSQDYKNAAVGKVTNGYFNGKVEWFPTELTTVSVNGSRAFSEVRSIATATTALTALTTTTGFTIDHELLRNLILSAAATQQKYNFTGEARDDTMTTYTFGARYFMSRRVSINASFNNQKLQSVGAQAFRSYTDNIIKVGVVLRY